MYLSSLMLNYFAGEHQKGWLSNASSDYQRMAVPSRVDSDLEWLHPRFCHGSWGSGFFQVFGAKPGFWWISASNNPLNISIWLVVWNIFIFPCSGSNPNWRTHIFQRGRLNMLNQQPGIWLSWSPHGFWHLAPALGPLASGFTWAAKPAARCAQSPQRGRCHGGGRR